MIRIRRLRRFRRWKDVAQLICAICVICGSAWADTADRNPTSDDAESGTWSGASAGSRYTLVDDHPDSAGSDFLTHGTTAGNLTLGFTAFSVPAGSTITSVAVIYYDQKTAAQAAAAAGRLKVGGNYYNASTHNPANGTWTLRTDTWTTNPDTGSNWTVDQANGSGGNALQAFGFFSNDASPTVRFSSVIVRVTYTPPAQGGPKRVYVSQVSIPLAGEPEIRWRRLPRNRASRRRSISATVSINFGGKHV